MEDKAYYLHTQTRANGTRCRWFDTSDEAKEAEKLFKAANPYGISERGQVIFSSRSLAGLLNETGYEIY